jgi:hypothetical protein
MIWIKTLAVTIVMGLFTWLAWYSLHRETSYTPEQVGAVNALIAKTAKHHWTKAERDAAIRYLFANGKN